MNLEPIRDALRTNLDAKYDSREQGLVQCRTVIRQSANCIRAIHRGEREQADRLLSEGRRLLDDARSVMARHPDILYAGFYHDACKEHAEARLTYALVFDLPLPSPEDSGVEPAAYLNGMAEAIGEVRRHLLDLMRRGQLDRSERLMDAMDEIYYLLIAMDYPDAMTGGLRRSTDVARSIIERTRGDLTTTIIQQGLKNALDGMRHDRI